VGHVGSVKNFQCVLLLRQEHAGGVSMDIDAKKVMESSKVSHGKFRGQR
jgi:hypothetical protein